MDKRTKISVFTLGCKTNLYESQQIIHALLERGFDAFDGLKRADGFILNTCAVTHEAESKSRQAVARARKLNPDCVVFVVGCAAQKNAQQFADIDNVVFVGGNADKTAIVDRIEQFLPTLEQKQVEFDDNILPYEYHHTIDATKSKTRALVKIQDGCNNYCSYCIVPYLRGVSRSRTIDSIVQEVRANADAKEFVLLGIDISQYGLDIGVTLADLITALQFVKGRIRLGSIYADAINDQLLTAMQVNACDHFHLSLQSGCDNTLRAMNRHYTTAEFAKAVERIRKFFPDAGITTDVIVGYPSETEEDFATTCEFVREVAFADIHVFPFSPRKGTVAYGLKPIDKAVMDERVNRLTQIKHQLKSDFADKYIGKRVQVLIEEYKKGFWSGYTTNYLRVFTDNKQLNENDLVELVVEEKFNEGVLGK